MFLSQYTTPTVYFGARSPKKTRVERLDNIRKINSMSEDYKQLHPNAQKVVQIVQQNNNISTSSDIGKLAGLHTSTVSQHLKVIEQRIGSQKKAVARVKIYLSSTPSCLYQPFDILLEQGRALREKKQVK